MCHSLWKYMTPYLVIHWTSPEPSNDRKNVIALFITIEKKEITSASDDHRNLLSLIF